MLCLFVCIVFCLSLYECVLFFFFFLIGCVRVVLFFAYECVVFFFSFFFLLVCVCVAFWFGCKLYFSLLCLCVLILWGFFHVEEEGFFLSCLVYVGIFLSCLFSGPCEEYHFYFALYFLMFDRI